MTLTKSPQSLGMILLQVDDQLNICITKSECMPNEIIASFTHVKSSITTVVQSAKTSRTMFKRYGESRQLSLVLDFSRTV